MTESKWIWLDMDGTFADLYSVNGWLEDLRNYKTRPYAEARPLYNMTDLINILVALKNTGWNVGIVSWLSKDPDKNYGKAVTKVKKEWLMKYHMTAILDEILIVPYGQCKADTCREFGFGILADDEERNRKDWNLGATINGNNNLLEELAKLL